MTRLCLPGPDASVLTPGAGEAAAAPDLVQDLGLQELAGELPPETVGGQLIGRVHSWDVSTGVDGPGTRFVLFLAGCPLRCLYCHNPDTWQMRRGTPMSVDDVMAQIAKFEGFIRAAGGGVTVSGGEPMLQTPFVTEIFRRCKERGLHTTLDTSGFLGARATDELLALTDLVLLDIKSWDRATYKKLTGVPLEPTLRFAERLDDAGVPTWVRFVLVPGVTDDIDNVDGVARFVADRSNVARVDVLPFHRLGEVKYSELGLRFPLADVTPPDDDLLERVRGQFRGRGVDAC